MAKVAVFGLGYVGLASAVLFAREHDVIAVDIDESRIAALNEGRSPIVDADIEAELRKEGIRARLTATSRAQDISGADFAIIATPTNYDDENNTFDTSSVEAVIDTIETVSPTTCIVIKSTVPIGFTDSMHEQHTNHPESVILFSPEFLREGKALWDNLHPSRIVVASKEQEPDHSKATEFAHMLAALAEEVNVPVHITRPREAESIKLFTNTYLAMRVAYFNELDTFAMKHGLNAESIIAGVCGDPRVGDYYNNPSFGYGGYCLPKDSKQLLANYNTIPQTIMSAIVKSNDLRKGFIANDILRRQPETVGVYRLAMKSGSDNFRASSIIDVMKKLRGEGVRVVVYEPSLAAGEQQTVLGFPLVDLDTLCGEADVILSNRWDEDLAPVGDKVYTRDAFHRD